MKKSYHSSEVPIRLATITLRTDEGAVAGMRLTVDIWCLPRPGRGLVHAPETDFTTCQNLRRLEVPELVIGCEASAKSPVPKRSEQAGFTICEPRQRPKR